MAGDANGLGLKSLLMQEIGVEPYAIGPLNARKFII
jgi:hypothetical protein